MAPVKRVSRQRRAARAQKTRLRDGWEFGLEAIAKSGGITQRSPVAKPRSGLRPAPER